MGETPATNPSLRPWNELPAAAAEDNRRQADEVGGKLAAVGCGLTALTDWDADLFTFTPEEIEILAEMEHQRWVDDHLREGVAGRRRRKRRQKTRRARALARLRDTEHGEGGDRCTAASRSSCGPA